MSSSSFFEKYYSILGKTCKKNPLALVDFGLVLSFFIYYELNFIHNTKNACVHLCSISEVVKPSSKMTLLYSKIVAMWHVQVKSPTHYFGSILIHTNLRGT